MIHFVTLFKQPQINTMMNIYIEEEVREEIHAILVEQAESLRPLLTWHVATILCCLSNIQEKKINATWQRYIKSLCVLIFLFCWRTFVWGAASRSACPGGRSSAENNVGIKQHVLSFLCRAASSQIISYSNTIHHSTQDAECIFSKKPRMWMQNSFKIQD